MVVLGFDPGIARTGYGIIEGNGGLKVLCYGTIETKPRDPFSRRILNLCRQAEELLKSYKPDTAVIEKVFFNKNVKTAIVTGEVIGAIILTCARSSIDIVEYTPLQIKQAIVGYGRAEKVQVQKMLQLLLGLKEIPKSDDAADALAAALTHINLSKYDKLIKDSGN